MNAIGQSFPAEQAYDTWLPLLQLAAQEVFNLMLNCGVQPSTAEVDDQGLDNTAMVGLAGKLCGMLTIRCRTKSAAVMASKMLGVTPESAGHAIWDALGEISNMVAGNFKNKISGMADGCMLSVPTVITGADYNLHPLAVSSAIRTILIFEGEPIVLSLEIHN